MQSMVQKSKTNREDSSSIFSLLCLTMLQTGRLSFYDSVFALSSIHFSSILQLV